MVGDTPWYRDNPCSTEFVAGKNCYSLSAHMILSLFADQTFTSNIFLAGSVGSPSLYLVSMKLFIYFTTDDKP
jgi:hypothetical protein